MEINIEYLEKEELYKRPKKKMRERYRRAIPGRKMSWVLLIELISKLGADII